MTLWFAPPFFLLQYHLRLRLKRTGPLWTDTGTVVSYNTKGGKILFWRVLGNSRLYHGEIQYCRNGQTSVCCIYVLIPENLVSKYLHLSRSSNALFIHQLGKKSQLADTLFVVWFENLCFSYDSRILVYFKICYRCGSNFNRV